MNVRLLLWGALLVVSGCAAPAAFGDRDQEVAGQQPGMDVAGDARVSPRDGAAAPADAQGDARTNTETAHSVDVAPDSPPVPGAGDASGARVRAFIAIGQGGRRLLSCDDGQSWRGEQKVNDSNDDHASWSSMGIAHGRGVFLALYGWFGADATAHVLRTADGLRWTETLGAGAKAAFGNDVAFGRETFVVNAVGSSVHVSSDVGSTWGSTRYGAEFGAPILRSMLFLDTGPGRFFAWGDNGRAISSDDGGKTWREHVITCGGDHARPSGAFGNGVLLLSGPLGVCRSVDGGRTFTRISRPAAGHLLWTGSDFYLSSLREAHRSPDGLTWTTLKTTRPSTGWIAVAAVNDRGTFVAADETGTHFYRSTDGITWTQQDRRPGTRITEIAAGYVQPSAECPAP